MPAYRVEVSPNNRAGCQDALCKSNAEKIMKGDIRFGVWVEGTSAGGHEFQSFRWRHWGCVSGKTIQHLRENLTGPLAEESEYSWDLLDGLEEMPPHYQDKIKLAITEGKIANEDWRGDPAYNVLGKTGIRGRVSSKKKDLDGEEEGVEKTAEAEVQTDPATKKRGRAKDDEDELAKPKKKLVSKKEDNEEKVSQLAVKAAVSKEEEDEPKPVRKSRGRKDIMGKEENEDVGNHVEAGDKGRIKKESQKGLRGEATLSKEESKYTTKDVKLDKKSRGKKAPEQEPLNSHGTEVENNESSDANMKASGITKAKKVLKREQAGNGCPVIKGEGNEHAKNLKPTNKHLKIDGIKEEEEGDSNISLNTEGKQALALATTRETYKAEMPEDPLEQIALAFCDRDGPLVSEFNEMVKNETVADDDWDGFLQKRFHVMVDSGEAANDDFNGFLQKMHEREKALGKAPPIPPKKGRSGKKPPKTLMNLRARRSRAD